MDDGQGAAFTWPGSTVAEKSASPPRACLEREILVPVITDKLVTANSHMHVMLAGTGQLHHSCHMRHRLAHVKISSQKRRTCLYATHWRWHSQLTCTGAIYLIYIQLCFIRYMCKTKLAGTLLLSSETFAQVHVSCCARSLPGQFAA